MFSTNYTDSHGNVHFLDDVVSNDFTEIEDLWSQYANRASTLSQQLDKSVFYGLRLINSKGALVQGNFFLIPIEEKEVDNIASIYHKDCLIGIHHKGNNPPKC